MNTSEELLITFNITKEESDKARLRFFSSQKKELEEKLGKWSLQLISCSEDSRWLCYQEINKIQGQLDKIKAATYVIKNPTQQSSIDIEQLKTSISIKDVFLTDWQYENGDRAKCKCPLHNERTASFVLYKKTNSFYCFGCKQGGSVIDLVMKLHNYDVKEAIKYLINFN